VTPRLRKYLAVSLPPVAIGSLFGTLIPANSSAHLTWYCDAVDADPEPDKVVWETGGTWASQYDFSRDWANNKWDVHQAVDVFHDNWLNNVNVSWWTMNENSTTTGRYTCSFPVTFIDLNRTMLDPLLGTSSGQDKIRKVAAHELGHGMDMDHHDGAGDIMKQGLFAVTGVTGLTHCEFHERWGFDDGHCQGK